MIVDLSDHTFAFPVRTIVSAVKIVVGNHSQRETIQDKKLNNSMDDETGENIPAANRSQTDGAQPEQAVTTGDVGGKSNATFGRSTSCRIVHLHLAFK